MAGLLLCWRIVMIMMMALIMDGSLTKRCSAVVFALCQTLGRLRLVRHIAHGASAQLPRECSVLGSSGACGSPAAAVHARPQQL